MVVNTSENREFKVFLPFSTLLRLVHITDWLPTLYNAIGGDVSDLGAIDGVDQWDALSNDFPSRRTEMLYNVELQDGKYLGAIRYEGYLVLNICS